MILAESFYEETIQPQIDENAVKYVQTMMFRKAMEVDLSCYENPEFYDRYVKALGESAARTGEFIDTLSNAAYVVVSLITNAALLLTIDPALAAFVIVPFAISFLKVKRDRLEYKKAMLLFYEQNNISAFKKIFIEQFRFAVETYF